MLRTLTDNLIKCRRLVSADSFTDTRLEIYNRLDLQKTLLVSNIEFTKLDFTILFPKCFGIPMCYVLFYTYLQDL
ncbi:Uncharacterized protein OBRU01_06460 [Operophtera brumata]|uniref:Uncharacterized protein n=1 Tax=Operophtera brumata TaxID=104452 RepID=A0A0L7LKR1_OPEBR|nr:Uncharacterized protein OBRU01_06460 [Operophtera brumata]